MLKPIVVLLKPIVVLTVGGGSDSFWSLLAGVMWWEACADTVFAAAAIVGCKKAVIVPSCCKNAVIVGWKKAEGSFTVRDQWQSHRPEAF